MPLSGTGSSDGGLKTDWKCWFRASALSASVVHNLVSVWRIIFGSYKFHVRPKCFRTIHNAFTDDVVYVVDMSQFDDFCQTFSVLSVHETVVLDFLARRNRRSLFLICLLMELVIQGRFRLPLFILDGTWLSINPRLTKGGGCNPLTAFPRSL